MNNLTSALLLTTLVAASACTVTTSKDIDPGTLAGMVDGNPWSFQTGQTDAFLSQDNTNFYATLYPSTFTPCLSDPDLPHLIVAVPKTVGDYDMDFSRNMTFVDGDLNMVAVDGRIVVDSISSDRITGGLHGTYDIDNEVSGQFDLHVCQ
jgi:hypothetical protein